MDPIGNIDMLTAFLFAIIAALGIVTTVSAVRRHRFELPTHARPGTVTAETGRWTRLLEASLEDAEDDLGRFRRRILAERAARTEAA